MRHFSIVVLAVMLLSACAPTKVPLAEVDLEPLLILQGDLPPGVSASQVRSSPPAMFDGLPQPTRQIYQAFEKKGDQSGGVAVLLYEDIGLAEEAYAFVLAKMGETEEVDLGDRSAFATIPLYGTDEIVTDLLWLRCNSVVHVRITSEATGATAYGERLNRRLESVVCP